MTARGGNDHDRQETQARNAGPGEENVSGVGELVARICVEGQQLEGVLALAPLGRLITSENADSYRPWRERVPYAPLHEGLD